MPRAYNFFDLFVFSAYPTSRISRPPDKAVILSEALRGSIASRELYGAESKDPGDACWQMLLGAFRPQTTTENKKVTISDHSDLSRLAVEAEVEEPAVFSPTPILSLVTVSLRRSASWRRGR
jgi:hypothetical protein